MKSNLRFLRRAPMGVALALALSTASAAAVTPSTSAAGPKGAAAAPKDHTLYLGADLSVDWKGKLRPVVGVVGSAFVVDVDGRSETVPTFAKDVKIKIDEALKVAATGANLADFKAERANTLDNDPQRRYEEAARNAAGAGAMADLAAGKVNEMQARYGFEHSYTPDPRDPVQPVYTVSQEDIAAAGVSRNEQMVGQSAAINSMADAGVLAGIDAARENYDAFRLTFKISAPRVLTKPYVVVVARYRDQPDQPKTARLWVYGQEVDRVDTTPRKFSLFRAGFPKGYQLENVKIHLYDQGVEIPTDEAPKRVMITADEAFQFGVIGYIEQHRGATLAAKPARTSIAPELRARVSGDKLGRTYYLKVSRNGLPLGGFVDPACSQQVDDGDLAAALASLRFHPALKEGKPIDSVVPVRLAAFAM